MTVQALSQRPFAKESEMFLELLSEARQPPGKVPPLWCLLSNALEYTRRGCSRIDLDALRI